jgi:hypothetical protein
MNRPLASTYSNKFIVCFYAEPDFLSLNILENLLSKNCLVNIITNDMLGWENVTRHLSKSLFGITAVGKNFIRQKYSYAIFSGGFFNNKNLFNSLNSFLDDSSIAGLKSLILFPVELYTSIKKREIKISENTAVVYVGDVLGPRINLDSQRLLTRHLVNILFKREMSIVEEENFYPMFVSDAAKLISKWLFSFGPYGREMLMVGRQVSAKSFWRENKYLIPELNANYKTSGDIRDLPSGVEKTVVESNLRFSLIETYKWITRLWESEKDTALRAGKTKRYVSTLKLKTPKLPRFSGIVVNPSKLRLAKILSFIIIVFLSLPILALFLATGLSYFSYNQFLTKGLSKVEAPLVASNTLFKAAYYPSKAVSYVPVIGRLYKEAVFVSETGEMFTEMALYSIPLGSDLTLVLDKILGNEIYDINDITFKLKDALSLYYQKAGELQSRVNEASTNDIKSAKFLARKIDFERLRILFLTGEVLVNNLPEILGESKRMSYLVLFQNNMELRPTGGFIGSYGIMNFDSGRLSELSVNDVYSADGQLKGHVEPPAPIKDYLGEANWWLRDSNWDPDFITSALRAEWFLDKAVDQKVDGVLSLDLEFVRGILRSTGGIFLPDFNLTIDENNLYERTQDEVENNFFPGSRKKASFLTALSRKLLSEISSLDSGQKMRVLQTLLKGLEERSVQVYLHDSDSQTAINQIGWSGQVAIPDCGKGCVADLLGFAEANVGVNKSNFFIERESVLTINSSPNVISRRLAIEYKNNANPALGLSGKYKNYIRILIPHDSEVLSVASVVGENVEEIVPDVSVVKGRKEVGVLTEVLGGQRKTLVFTWKTDTKENQFNKYGIYIRKQAGVPVSPLRVEIISPYKLSTKPEFGLTRDGVYTYNTDLRRDFVSLFAW